MSSRNRYAKAIEQAAGDAPPVPDASQVYQTTVPPIPRKGERAYEYTDNGLVIRRELNERDWNTIPAEIKAVTGSSRPLNIGDAAFYGLEHGYIQSYEQAAELFGVKAGSVEFYVSICRNVPQLIRANSLTFKHYRYIAPLPDDEKIHWIQFAASNGLSSSNLKALIEIAYPPELPASIGENAPIVTVVVDAPALSEDEDNREAEEIAPVETIKEAKKTFNHFIQCVSTNRLHEMSRGELYAFLQFVQSKYEQRRKMGE